LEIIRGVPQRSMLGSKKESKITRQTERGIERHRQIYIEMVQQMN